MAVIYSNPLKDTRMNDVIHAIDAGSGPGTFEICTANYAVVLCILTLQKPSFSEANQTITVSGVPITGTAAAAGTATVGRFKDSNGNIIISGLTVGTAGSDIIINTTTVSVSDPLVLISGTIAHS